MSTLRSSVDTDIKIKEDISVSDQVSSELAETKVDLAAESATDKKDKLINEVTPLSSQTTPSIIHNETTSTEDETIENLKQDNDDTSDGAFTCSDNNVQTVNPDT